MRLRNEWKFRVRRLYSRAIINYCYRFIHCLALSCSIPRPNGDSFLTALNIYADDTSNVYLPNFGFIMTRYMRISIHPQ
jgi:hypothetical protein